MGSAQGSMGYLALQETRGHTPDRSRFLTPQIAIVSQISQIRKISWDLSIVQPPFGRVTRFYPPTGTD